MDVCVDVCGCMWMCPCMYVQMMNRGQEPERESKPQRDREKQGDSDGETDMTTRLTGVLSREAADAALASPVRCGCKCGDGSRVVTGAEDTPAAPLDTEWAACMHAACV